MALSSGRGEEKTIRELKAGKSSLDVVAFQEGTGLVVVGARDGLISVFDITSKATGVDASGKALADSPILAFKRSGAPITSLSFSSSTNPEIASLLVGTADGLPCRVSWGKDNVVKVMEEFAGLDCDAAVIREARGAIWVGAADGKLRRYRRVGEMN